jgi:UDP-N-acetyl-D-mannosaminuronate dehydrogenase
MCAMSSLTRDSQVINQYRHLVSMAQDFPTVPWTIVSATMTDTNMVRLLKELQINTIVPHHPVNRDRPNIYYEVIYNEQDTLPLIAKMLEEGCVILESAVECGTTEAIQFKVKLVYNYLLCVHFSMSECQTGITKEGINRCDLLRRTGTQDPCSM